MTAVPSTRGFLAWEAWVTDWTPRSQKQQRKCFNVERILGPEIHLEGFLKGSHKIFYDFTGTRNHNKYAYEDALIENIFRLTFSQKIILSKPRP